MGIGDWVLVIRYWVLGSLYSQSLIPSPQSLAPSPQPLQMNFQKYIYKGLSMASSIVQLGAYNKHLELQNAGQKSRLQVAIAQT
jgi:hypothetical protein